MEYSFHPEASTELDEAADYYESCRAGLGLEFAEEVYASIQLILEFPNAWTPMTENTRRCLTNRFPYGIIYEARNEEVFIIAVMQLNRRPGYWRDRVS